MKDKNYKVSKKKEKKGRNKDNDESVSKDR